jgi:hypothetical protein
MRAFSCAPATAMHGGIGRISQQQIEHWSAYKHLKNLSTAKALKQIWTIHVSNMLCITFIKNSLIQTTAQIIIFIYIFISI